MKTAQAHNDQLTGRIEFTPEIRPTALEMILEHQHRFNSSAAEAFKVIETFFERKTGMVAFKSLDGFNKFKQRHPEIVRKHEMSKKMSTINGECEQIFKDLEDSLPIYASSHVAQRHMTQFVHELSRLGMHLQTRDADSPRSSRLNEMDKLIRDEERRFLEDVVRIVNHYIDNPPKDRKHISLEDIRQSCARRRKKSAERFEQELASDPPEII